MDKNSDKWNLADTRQH